MANPVVVTANDQGQVVIPSSNPEFGYVRVEQVATSFNGGWMRKEKRSAIIRGKFEDLESLGFKAGQPLPGKIQVIESLVPTNPNDPKQDLKVNPQNGEMLVVDDQPIYRTAQYVQDVNAADVLLQHTNVQTRVVVDPKVTSSETVAP